MVGDGRGMVEEWSVMMEEWLGIVRDDRPPRERLRVIERERGLTVSEGAWELGEFSQSLMS